MYRWTTLSVGLMSAGHLAWLTAKGEREMIRWGDRLDRIVSLEGRCERVSKRELELETETDGRRNNASPLLEGRRVDQGSVGNHINLAACSYFVTEPRY